MVEGVTILDTTRPKPKLTLLVVCGLRSEALRVAWPGVATVVGGGRREALEGRLASIDPGEIGAVASFGLAGALDPGLAAGDLILPQEVVAESRRHRVSSDLMAAWLGRARDGMPPIKHVDAIVGVDHAVATTAAKASLREQSSAQAVDMESHVAAAYAERHGLPFGVLRVVSDGADRAVPPAATVALREDGGIDIPAVLRSLIRRPAQIPAFCRTAVDGMRAFDALRRAGHLLRPEAGRGGMLG